MVIAPVFRVPLLHRIGGIVADKEVPPHRIVLAGEAMESRQVIIVRQAIDPELIVIATRESMRVAPASSNSTSCPASASRVARTAAGA